MHSEQTTHLSPGPPWKHTKSQSKSTFKAQVFARKHTYLSTHVQMTGWWLQGPGRCARPKAAPETFPAGFRALSRPLGPGFLRFLAHSPGHAVCLRLAIRPPGNYASYWVTLVTSSAPESFHPLPFSPCSCCLLAIFLFLSQLNSEFFSKNKKQPVQGEGEGRGEGRGKSDRIAKEEASPLGPFTGLQKLR